jgi:DNA-binding NarL/FixJ family response regulator
VIGGGQPTLGLSASRLVGRIAVTDDGGVPVRVLIVDDNPRFRLRARRCLEASVYEVVAEAADGASALEAARRHRPAVVLLDIELPDTSGLSVAERLAREPAPPVVVLTSTHDAADFGERLLRCGARGFVPKAELSGERLSALLA